MPDEVTTTDPNVIDVDPPAATPGQEPKTYSENYVQRLRSEAARYRTEKTSAVDAAKEAVSNEWQSKVDGITADLGDSWIYAEKLHAAINAQVPAEKVLDFAAILQGSDPDSIKASAEKAKALFGVPAKVTATDTTQGSGNTIPLNGDPLLAKLKQLVGPPRQ
jgi:hypothetical protein